MFRVFYYFDLQKGVIFSNSMDCTGYTARFIANARGATGLALDDNAQVLYWTEFFDAKIKLYNIKAGDIRELTISDSKFYLSKPFGLTVLGNYLFFTAWQKQCIGRVSKHGGDVIAISCDRNSKLHGISRVRSDCSRPNGI